MTIRHLTVFAAVAEQGSMSAALNVLEKSFISQNGESFFFPMPVK